MLEQLKQQVARKSAQLDGERPLTPDALAALEHYYDLELTYTSNAIEGNTLTASETALVVEQGLTIGGKPLKHHMEAIDHFDAIRYVRTLAREPEPLSAHTVRTLHGLVVKRAEPEIAGQYATHGRYVVTDTGRFAFPPPAEVPALMGSFSDWLQAAPMTADTGFDAHRRLVGIHPFNDGNGRTARLLMNLILIRSGYPPISVRPIDRPRYIAALQTDQAGGGQRDLDTLLYERLDATLGEFLGAFAEAIPARRPKPARSLDEPSLS